MIYLLYDLILCLSALILVPYYLLRGVRYGKARRGIRERLGFLTSAVARALRGRQVIWVHAVSVGETRAAFPLFKALRKAYPEARLVISNVTETGREIANKIPEADFCIFFPFDLSWVVRKVLRTVNPAVIVLVETEIWPNFVRVARQENIPIVLVNGRISDRSFPRYRMAGKLLPPILECISSFCMQTGQDARRIKLLGADKEHVRVTGNLKFDMALPSESDLDQKALRQTFRLPAEAPVWVAGSTHQGEEEIILKVYSRLRRDCPDLCLVLVPRHPERSRMVQDEAQRLGLDCVLRTALAEQESDLRPGDVLLVDTIGEMLKLYAAADLVFVGGSLIPIGGHNILEASLVKKPVLFGSHMHNFKEITKLVLQADGGIQVKDADDLFQQIRLLTGSADECQRIGANGHELLVKNQGTTERTLAEIASQVPE
jgi:3-deoxy-D-manno-octulosonic-acid transferase